MERLAQDGLEAREKRKAASQAPISKQHGPGSDHWEWSDGKPLEYNNCVSSVPNNWDGRNVELRLMERQPRKK